MSKLTEAQLQFFSSVLDDKTASPFLKTVSEQVLQVYLMAGGGEEGKEAAGREYLKINARFDVAAFADYVLELPPEGHHRAVLEAIQDESRKRLCIVASPGSAKSTMVSFEYPLYFMGKYPDKSIVMLANAMGQVEKWVSQIRPIMEGDMEEGRRYHEVFPEVLPDPNNWTKEKLYLANRSKASPYPNLHVSGMGSTNILGTRADLIILDDVTSGAQARSAIELQKQREDLANIVMSRLVPDGRVIAIMTRWHSDDLVPHLVNDLNFELLHMPALVDHADEPNGLYVDFIPSRSHLYVPDHDAVVKEPQWIKHPDGDAWVEKQLQDALKKAKEDGFEAKITTSQANEGAKCVRKYLYKEKYRNIWPTRWGPEHFEQVKDQGPVSFRLVYQGDPTGVTGDIYKRDWFRYFGREEDPFIKVPANTRKYMTVDVATGTAKKAGDYFVLLVVEVDSYGNKFIVDHFRSNETSTTLQPGVVKDFYQRHPDTMGILIETTNYQVALFNTLTEQGLPVIPVKPVKNKLFRLEAGAIFYQQGKVFLPYYASWKDEFIDEHTEFPKGKYDDQIDAASQLFEWLSQFQDTELVLEINFG